MSAADSIRGLYAITDPALTPGDTLLSACEIALAAGLRLLQYRNKTAPAATRLHEARALAALCTRFNATLLINDDPQLARDSGAAGVHIGQQDGGVARARALLGPDALIGVTCHGDINLAQHAIAEGADYVAFGRFFPSHTKPQAPAAPLSVLEQARTLGVPVVAIGGVNPDNAPQLLAAGADAVAVIHGVFGQPDIAAAVRRFISLPC